MDTLNYKQEAKNILKLLDSNFSKGDVAQYVEWILEKRSLWHRYHDYVNLCKIMKFLELPEPTEEEWKKR